MDIKDTLEEVKSRMASGYQTLERKIEEGLRHTHILPEDAVFMQECAAAIAATYEAKGYATQVFRFTENDSLGILVQICTRAVDLKRRLAATLGGQQLAVNVRFFPHGEDLEVSIECGKWIDKALSGVLAWTVFAPLVAFPVIGVLRQRRLIEQVERETLDWLAHRHNASFIDV